MSRCDVRYEILIDDLDAVLDETNLLIDTQITLQGDTAGYVYNSRNDEISAPER